MRWLLSLLLVTLALGCDSRAAQVEKCVEAYQKAPGTMTEGHIRAVCMRSAYGGSLTSP